MNNSYLLLFHEKTTEWILFNLYNNLALITQKNNICIEYNLKRYRQISVRPRGAYLRYNPKRDADESLVFNKKM